MLPPTIITAPTSATARPKPASATVVRAIRASHRSACTTCTRVRQRDRNWSRYSLCRSSSTCRDSAATMGVIRMVCATIIAVGV